MTAEQFQKLRRKLGLRQEDVATICGVNTRTVRSWCIDQSPAPLTAAMILIALDEGRIDDRWLANKIRSLTASRA